MTEARILNQVDLPEGIRAILYDWMDAGRNNLVLISPSGNRAYPEPPFPADADAEDCFTNIEWAGEKLIAHSWTGYRISIDIQTGTVTVLNFTK